MSLLNQIHHGRQMMPPRLLVYGTEGIGKSTYASKMPSAIFIQCEDGLAEIDCDSFPMATSLDDVKNQLQALRDEDHDYQTIVIDSLSGLERLIIDEVQVQNNVDDIEMIGYQRGWKETRQHWRGVLDTLQTLRQTQAIATALIAHAQCEKFADPESESYNRYSPRLHKIASALVCEWCDAVLFATRQKHFSEEDQGFNKKRKIAQPLGANGGERVLRCIGSPTCIAKNRYDMPEEIALDWPATLECIRAIAQEAPTEVGPPDNTTEEAATQAPDDTTATANRQMMETVQDQITH